jgi:hypothetical protein
LKAENVNEVAHSAPVDLDNSVVKKTAPKKLTSKKAPLKKKSKKETSELLTKKASSIRLNKKGLESIKSMKSGKVI